MPTDQAAVLQRWANGDYYPLSADEQGSDALTDLAKEMAKRPDQWWHAFRRLLAKSDREATQNLNMPFAALLAEGGERIWDQVAEIARRDRKIANAFWHAMWFAKLSAEAYKRLGRRMTLQAFVRHEPRIGTKPGEPWPDVWEDEWSGDVLFYLTAEDVQEAWAMALDLLTVKDDPYWASTIGAFIIEDLLHDHGDEFIDRIEAEAKHNERLRMSLPTTEWMVPEHLMERVKAAAGPYWVRKHSH